MNTRLSKMLMDTESESHATPMKIDACYSHWVDDLLEKIERARQMEDSSRYSDLESSIDDLRSDLRESIQAVTRKPMWEIIKKLRTNGSLSQDDLKLIRLWIIGDAEAYIHEENSYPDWIEELDRLTAEIQKLRGGPIKLGQLEELGALLTDARGVTRSLALFLNDRERVQRFEASVRNGLDESTRETLANALTRSYHSDRI